MADLKGRSKDMKDKVVGEGKEAYGKATDDKSKETEGKAQSLGADIKEKLRDSAICTGINFLFQVNQI